MQRGGATLRNLYYVAVISYGQKDYATAAEYFKRAIARSPGSPSEADFADFMKSEAKRGLPRPRRCYKLDLRNDEIASNSSGRALWAMPG